MTPAIEATGLTKRYSSLFNRSAPLALAGVDLSVARGTAFGLIGPNGAGKTTFIKLILGVARPTAGRVRVLGGDPEDPRVRARVGYLPERLHLPQAWRPLELLESVGRLKRVRARRAELTALLSRVGLEEVVGRRIGGFSKGMRQRLGLATALLGSPELLVLDEPTDGVDPLGRVEVRGLLADELQRGTTVFLNSHLLAETERVCGHVGILAKGRLVREGPLDALTRAGALYRARFAPGVDPAALAALGFTPEGAAPGVFTVTATDARALNALLDGARATGALLLELSPEARDLEDVLQDALGAAA